MQVLHFFDHRPAFSSGSLHSDSWPSHCHSLNFRTTDDSDRRPRVNACRACSRADPLHWRLALLTPTTSPHRVSNRTRRPQHHPAPEPRSQPHQPLLTATTHRHGRRHVPYATQPPQQPHQPTQTNHPPNLLLIFKTNHPPNAPTTHPTPEPLLTRKPPFRVREAVEGRFPGEEWWRPEGCASAQVGWVVGAHLALDNHRLNRY